MKTLTITISDEAAAGLERAIEGGTHTAEQVAGHVVEATYADWGDIDEGDIAAIEEGMAQLDRGEGVPHAEVMNGLGEK